MINNYVLLPINLSTFNVDVENEKQVELYERLSKMMDEFVTLDVSVDMVTDGQGMFLLLPEGLWESWNLFDVIHKFDFMIKNIVFPWGKQLLVSLKDMKE